MLDAFGHDCRGAKGTITIDVPLADVSLDPGVEPFSSRLYSVTASTMTLPEAANTVPSEGGVGGVPFNVIDVAPSYDAVPEDSRQAVAKPRAVGLFGTIAGGYTVAMPADEERLVDLGLTTYEAKAYLALLRRDSSTPADVARLARVPRQRIYDVLATLVQKGLVSQRPGPPAKYAAASPDFAIERLLLRRREQLAELERNSREMIEALTPTFAEGQKERDPLEYIEVLRDRRAINERFGELQENIEREILVFTKPPYATPAQENVEGIQVTHTHTARSVYEFSALDDPDFAAGVRRFISAGEEARFVEELPLKLVIIDETIVMFGMEDPVAGSTQLTLAVVEHRALARLLKIAFEAVWEQGVTIDDLDPLPDATTVRVP